MLILTDALFEFVSYSDAVSNEPIGTHYIDLNEISDIGQGSNDGGKQDI